MVPREKKTMLMQNLGGQTKSIMVFSEVAYYRNARNTKFRERKGVHQIRQKRRLMSKMFCPTPLFVGIISNLFYGFFSKEVMTNIN